MKHNFLSTAWLTLFVGICGCVRLPSGPSVQVMPAPGKPFDLFVDEEDECTDFASSRAGSSPQQIADENVVTSAAVGTALGAGAGVAIGAISGHPGVGAIAGAGTGLLAGSANGTNAAAWTSLSAQRRFDIAYEQCMYAKGNQVPGFPIVYNTPQPPPPPVR